jgi:uncharacterized membrane protein YedE/YeeE
MTEAQLATLQWQVLGATGLLSFALGVIFHRSHFCTMGAVSDAVIMGHFDRLRQWALAVAIAVLGFGWMTYGGYISPLQSVFAQPGYWLARMVGGFLFGWGMVWASGCGAKSIVRAGAGNLKSVFVLLVMGIVALASMKGALAIPRVYLFEQPQWTPSTGLFAGQWLSAWFGFNAATGSLVAALLVALALSAWIFKDKQFINARNVATGLSVGLIICVVWAISGILGHGLEHPETLEEFFLSTTSGKMEALSLTAPFALGLDALMYFSDGTKRLTLGMVSVLGIFVGACISALLNGSFKLEAFTNADDFIRHAIGASLMGFGAVLALGCSIGQGLSGMSTLNLMSFLATLSILAGAYAALKYNMSRL